ncbi:MAG: glycosyl transferase family protein [Trueperaceae bacterium]|nr:glycosyl transferase family protein [Trueperaceae bacterium]
MLTTTITAITILVLLGYILASFDDFIFDIIYMFKYKQLKPRTIVPSSIQWDEPRPLAIMIPAYGEAGVVGPMIKSTLELSNYPSSRVTFFVGVYPNDTATVEEVYELSKTHPNVHCVVNSKAGPTNKSQNLNEVIKYIKLHEQETGKRFAAIAVHDAEDVIHPYTFKLYNTLLNQHAVVQLPVFALFPKVNFWQRLITGTYIDEFAEHHLHHVPIREHLGMFVPSAGTGFAIRRDVVERMTEQGPLFNEKSLTEDYEMALRMWQLGIKVHFHVQQVQRIDENGKLKDDFIAVREYFPSEIPAAIKQKGRWTYGITIQAPKLIDWSKLSFKDKFTLLRDQKGKFTNLIHIIAYPLFFYAILSAFLPLPHVESKLVWILGFIVLGITLERLMMRFHSVKTIYGVREAMMATFFLPLFPIRWVLANYINMMATFRAWRIHFWPNGFAKSKTPAKKGSTPKWDKTERKGYVSEDILNATRRRLGDNLLFYNDVEKKLIADLIQQQRQARGDKKKLGEIMMDERLMSNAKLRKRLAEILNTKPSKLNLDEE